MRTGSSIITLVILLVLFNGCSSVKPVHPVSVKQGVIGISSDYQNKNVVFIEVLAKDENAHPKRVPMVGRNTGMIAEREDPSPFTSVWAIKAESPVPAKNLKIIPGVVPKDFMQIVPGPSEKFKPVEDQEYYVVVMLEPVDSPFYSMGSKWIP